MDLKFEIENAGASGLRLAILDADDVLWPHPGADDGASVFEAEDVLSYLADAWPSILLSETWPCIFEPVQEPRSMTGLLRAAEERWEQMSESEENEIRAEQDQVDAFLYRHDLASMKHGARLDSLYILRQADRVRLETNGQVLTSCSFKLFIENLGHLGEAARTRLAAVEGPHSRTVARWDMRDTSVPALFVSYMTGLQSSDLRASDALRVQLLSSLEGRGLMEVANDNTEPLFAVARSSGRLGPRGIAGVITAFRALPHGNVDALKERQRRIQAIARDVSNPTDQGIRAANAFRDWLHQPDDAKIDLDEISRRLGIMVSRSDDLDDRVDGLASAGPQHGPAILLNRNTARRGSHSDDLERSIRFTWAHELGHLLLDDAAWPAIVDTAQQRTPRWIETRANAFAAYLLLPSSVAYRPFDGLGPNMSWSSAEGILNTISSQFGVTRIVASRQVERGAPFERRGALRELFRANVRNF